MQLTLNLPFGSVVFSIYACRANPLYHLRIGKIPHARYAVSSSCKQMRVRVTELAKPTHEVHQRIKHFFIYSRMCGGKVIFYLLLKLIVSCDIINVTILVLKEK